MYTAFFFLEDMRPQNKGLNSWNMGKGGSSKSTPEKKREKERKIRKAWIIDP